MSCISIDSNPNIEDLSKIKVLLEWSTNLLFKLYQDEIYKENPSLKKMVIKFPYSSERGYFRHDRENNIFYISYGLEMLKNFRYYSVGKTYTHAKEIKKFGFFNKKISVQTLIVSLVIHEFGHLLQCIRKQRYFKSIHNKEFHSILKELYKKGIGDKLMNKFMEYDFFKNLKFIETDSRDNLNYGASKIDFLLGEQVKFDYKGERFVGIISDLKTKSVNVKVSRFTYKLDYEQIKRLTVVD